MLDKKQNPENGSTPDIESGAADRSVSQEERKHLGSDESSTSSAAPMCSPKRRATGPRTSMGKERSRRNAVTHGIFADAVLLGSESRKEFNAHRRGMFDYWQPEGTAQVLDVEIMVTTSWRMRRALIAETALIGRSMRFPKVKPTIQYNDVVHILVHHEGQEKFDGLLLSMGAPKMSDRDYCISLLRELEEGISDGFHEARDSQILSKLYGQQADHNNEDNLLTRYHTCLAMATCSDDERQKNGFPGPDKCKVRFLKEIRSEIDRLERLKSFEDARSEVERLVQNVPDDPQLDRLLRYQAALEREYSDALNRLERLQRARRGQPLPPRLEIQHSIS
jgi:hypothetical protein